MNIDVALLVLRFALGVVFLYHGLAKRPMWKMRPSDQMSAGMLFLMRFLSAAEPLAGLALILGFLTEFDARGVALIMIGALWFKILKWKMPFSTMTQTGWEFDLVNLAIAIALIILGGGQLAVDVPFM